MQCVLDIYFNAFLLSKSSFYVTYFDVVLSVLLVFASQLHQRAEHNFIFCFLIVFSFENTNKSNRNQKTYKCNTYRLMIQAGNNSFLFTG